MMISKSPKDGGLLFAVLIIITSVGGQIEYRCPAQEKILPCRCSTRGTEFQIWCSHSELPKVLEGLSAVGRYLPHPVDELILENNNLPSLPGKVFTNLRVLRLMLRNNRLERVSSGWLEGLHDSLLELFLVEPDLRSLPIDSLDNLQGLEAITLQSKSMKRLPRFTGLSKLRYLQINSPSLLELSPMSFKDLPNLEQLHIFGSPNLVRLEAGLFQSLPKLSIINITDCGITWIHPRSFVDLPQLYEISFKGNSISDAVIVGRAITELPELSIIHLDDNKITRLQEESFVDLSSLSRLSLSNNFITEILPGAFQRLPLLRVLNLNDNKINRIHSEFFIQRTGSSLEEFLIIGNNLNHVKELRYILEALPRLKLLDVSYNYFEEIPFGALRGHPTLERFYLDHNRLIFLQRETFTAMPALRELSLKNNSLSNNLDAPYWNLPSLKGLDLSENYFRHVEPMLFAYLPNLRRLDLSSNMISHVEPESFIETSRLEYLNLSRNIISMIHPGTMRHLPGLYELDLSWNRLLEIVSNLPKRIEHLHLSMNKISNLPTLESQDLALPALRSLDISANKIERISPGTFSELSSLKKLNLGYNSIRFLEDNNFDGLFRLEQLDLRYNRLISLHEKSFRPLRSLMDLILHGNRVEVLSDDVFHGNLQLQRLDLARNNLAKIPHSTFTNTRDLRELYASHNILTELPNSLHGLSSLEVLDLSFNDLNILSPDTLSSLTSLSELKLVRNKIKELRKGAFYRLPRLSLIDLENNDLRIIEKNSIKNLPELQAIRLGKNKIQLIPNGAFSDLPLLQSAELQENNIHEISSNAFVNVPHILFLNLSHNLLPSLEHAGLSSLRSLEVLDVSNNRLTKVSTESLALMEWLVELKMDNNRICKIQGVPFNDMPRLRVLSMRKNRMTSVSESAFKRLRSNIAILDIDGNPLSCSCEMMWLRGWLQQGSTEGPRCADGTLFREIRLSRQDCLQKRQSVSINNNCETEMNNQDSPTPSYNDENSVPVWMNPPKPTKLSFHQDDSYNDYTENYHENTNEEMNHATSSSLPAIEELETSEFTGPTTASTSNKIPHSVQKPSAQTTKKNPLIPKSPGSSGFTFFGVPLPSLNFNMWGNPEKKQLRNDNGRPGRSRYRTFQPEPEIQRGNFHPLPQPQGGFLPIIDPRLTFDKKSKNTTTKITNKTATITRIQAEKLFNKTSKIDNDKKKDKVNYKNDELLTLINDTTAVSSKTKIRRVPSSLSFITIKPENLLNKKEDNKTVSSSIEIFEDENVDLEEKELKENVTSEISWTLPALLSSTDKFLIASSTEAMIQTKKKLDNLLEVENHTSLSEPIDPTTPMSSSDKGIFLVSTEKSVDNLKTTVSTMKKQILTPQSRLEASALSAFLIPGGQIKTSVPIGKTLGRSTIEKVPSPRMTNQSSIEQSQDRSIIVSENDDDFLSKNNVKTVKENDPFNWYFQNYNESNLEPYLAIMENGKNSIGKLSKFTIFLLVIFHWFC